MAETVNYHLYISSNEMSNFKDWREQVAGETGSNMVKIDAELAKKQDKISGAHGQVVGFDADGNPVAQAAPDTGVTAFNGRTGAVTPQSGDYTAADVGAKAAGWSAFHFGTTAPEDTTQLWIDTTANTGGLKYYNGTQWTAVPVIWG